MTACAAPSYFKISVKSSYPNGFVLALPQGSGRQRCGDLALPGVVARESPPCSGDGDALHTQVAN